ncbi:MAG: o-succinylbenzoate--CoA ligase [Anaerolineales bacterium]|nr:o-succinylbenzoate--CoA ligase [Anaerolineales bacterium]
MDWLAECAAQTPDSPALIFNGQTWTYDSLNHWAESIAALLESRGVERGARVAVHLSNQPAYVLLIHALVRVGAVAVPLNIRLTESELKWQIQQSQCEFLVCNQDFFLSGSELIGSEERILVSDDFSTPQQIPVRTHPPLEPDSVQGIFFTSGTTGSPKGAMLTFANHHASALASAERLGVDPHDRWLLTMPLYHIGGMSIAFRAAIYGITIVLHSGFDVDAVHHALTNENITHVSLVPTMLHRLLEKYPDFTPSPSLRAILLGGAGAPASLLETAITLNLPIALTYGLTEAASQVATSTPEQVRAKPGSVGKPLQDTSIDIVDESGKSLPNGEIGGIVVSGGTVMQGYLDYDRPDRFLRSPRRGKPVRSIHTGDIGYLDSDGDLWVLTRRSDLIVSGGENVYPEEVERVLLTHPAVSEACIFGIPDSEWGQSVAAAVVLREPCNGENLIQFLRGQVAGYKVPRHIVFVESLPHTASGKLMRAKVASECSATRFAMSQPKLT